MATLICNINSYYYHGNTPVTIIMPDCPFRMKPEDYYNEKKEYKVLWLLHGAGGDSSDWIRKSRIELYAQENEIVVIMPSCYNTMYANTPMFKVEDFIFSELMPMMQNWLPISKKRDDNFIAGLSMGGNGALKLAWLHPEKFSAVASLSASPFSFEDLDEVELNRGGLLSLYGSKDALLSSNDNTWRLAKDVATHSLSPKIYCSVGTDDKHVLRVKNFWDYAESLGLNIMTEEFTGYAHEWRCWDLAIQHALKFFGFTNIRE